MRRVRGWSTQAIRLLATFGEAPKSWQHGYDLSKRTGLKPGTLYPLLMRLARQGVLEAQWRDSPQPGRPPRHAYRLTSDGRALVREVLADNAHVALLKRREGRAT